MRRPTGDEVLTNFKMKRETSDVIDKYCELSTKLNGKRVLKGKVINEMVENSLHSIQKKIDQIEKAKFD